MMGAATQQGWTFEQCLEIGAQGNAQMVTVGTSLDHCHIPGREHHEHVPDNACVLGMGIHNEPVGIYTKSLSGMSLTSGLPGSANTFADAFARRGRQKDAALPA